MTSETSSLAWEEVVAIKIAKQKENIFEEQFSSSYNYNNHFIAYLKSKDIDSQPHAIMISSTLFGGVPNILKVIQLHPNDQLPGSKNEIVY